MSYNGSGFYNQRSKSWVSPEHARQHVGETVNGWEKRRSSSSGNFYMAPSDYGFGGMGLLQAQLEAQVMTEYLRAVEEAHRSLAASLLRDQYESALRCIPSAIEQANDAMGRGSYEEAIQGLEKIQAEVRKQFPDCYDDKDLVSVAQTRESIASAWIEHMFESSLVKGKHDEHFDWAGSAARIRQIAERYLPEEEQERIGQRIDEINQDFARVRRQELAQRALLAWRSACANRVVDAFELEERDLQRVIESCHDLDESCIPPEIDLAAAECRFDGLVKRRRAIEECKRNERFLDEVKVLCSNADESMAKERYEQALATLKRADRKICYISEACEEREALAARVGELRNAASGRLTERRRVQKLTQDAARAMRAADQASKVTAYDEAARLLQEAYDAIQQLPEAHALRDDLEGLMEKRSDALRLQKEKDQKIALRKKKIKLQDKCKELEKRLVALDQLCVRRRKLGVLLQERDDARRWRSHWNKAYRALIILSGAGWVFAGICLASMMMGAFITPFLEESVYKPNTDPIMAGLVYGSCFLMLALVPMGFEKKRAGQVKVLDKEIAGLGLRTKDIKENTERLQRSEREVAEIRQQMSELVARLGRLQA